jgi:hypothetical protein
MERNRVARLALAECVVNLDGPSPEEIAAEAAAAAAADTQGGDDTEGDDAGDAVDNKPNENTGAKSAARLMTDLKTVSGDLKAETDGTNKRQYKNMEEAKEAFKEMLADKNVPPDAKWNEAMAKGIANDKRFRALKTMAQRKQVSVTVGVCESGMCVVSLDMHVCVYI